MLAVFDIDGVVADVRHRVHHLERHHDWEAFFAAADRDPLLAEGARLAADLAGQHEIVWLTGRPELLRDVTTAWLAAHELPGAAGFSPSGRPLPELHMRPVGDHRPARRYKLGVLADLAPRGIAAVIDDDEIVVGDALAAGYPAVLADWVVRGNALRRAQERDGRT